MKKYFLISILSLAAGAACYRWDVLPGYGADFCWAFAFAFALQGLLRLKGRKRFLLFGASLLGILFEGMQALRLAPGTADPLDAAVYTAAAAAAVIMMGRMEKEDEKRIETGSGDRSVLCIFADGDRQRLEQFVSDKGGDGGGHLRTEGNEKGNKGICR